MLFRSVLIPLAWAVRRQSLKTGLPLRACCAIPLVEELGFRFWLSDQRLIFVLPLLLICTITPIGLVMVAVEVQLRTTYSHHETIIGFIQDSPQKNLMSRVTKSLRNCHSVV